MENQLPSIRYPALLWTPGYVFFAEEAVALCTTPRSMFEGGVSLARTGKMHLADSDGKCFDIIDWHRVAPFGGFAGFARWLLRSIFAVPVLAQETHPPLEEFKKILARAISSRIRYDLDKSEKADVLEKLRRATSSAEAIAVLRTL